MATASLKSKAVQTAIRSAQSKTAARLKAQAADAMQKLKNKVKTAANTHGRDIISMTVDPIATGAAGAFALDMALKPLASRITDSARGDVIKTAIAVGAAYAGSKYVKSPYVRHAAVGAAIVNMHRLATRVVNRASAGTLKGLFTEDGAGDLAGWPAEGTLGNAAAMGGRVAVDLHLTDGSVVPGYADRSGNLYDGAGRYIPMQQPRALPLAGMSTQADPDFESYNVAAMG